LDGIAQLPSSTSKNTFPSNKEDTYPLKNGLKKESPLKTKETLLFRYFDMLIKAPPVPVHPESNIKEVLKLKSFLFALKKDSNNSDLKPTPNVKTLNPHL